VKYIEIFFGHKRRFITQDVAQSALGFLKMFDKKTVMSEE